MKTKCTRLRRAHFHRAAQFVSGTFGNKVKCVISKQQCAVLLIVDYKICPAVLMHFVCSHVYEFVIIALYSKSSLTTNNNRLNNWLSNLALFLYLLFLLPSPSFIPTHSFCLLIVLNIHQSNSWTINSAD